MRFLDLRIRNFRNLEDTSFEPHERFNIIVGQNGQGKTNLLEAIHTLATLRSFRTRTNRELVRHDQDQARVAGRFQRGSVRRDAALELRGGRRKVSLNDNPVRELSQYFGAINTVVFTPDDVTVLRDSKGARRLFVDRAIFNLAPAYALESSEFEKALKNRNATLKADRLDTLLLDTLDQQLATLGARVVSRRAEFVRELRQPLEEAFQGISGPTNRLRLDYVPNHSDPTVGKGDTPDHQSDDVIAEALVKKLREARRTDLRRGFTTVGPHRDDFDVLLNGHSMGQYASQGQHRAFVLAFKVTEMRELRRLLGSYPILLLDDVSSELDPAKNARLFEFVHSIDGQVFVTTTDRQYVHLDSDFAVWNMQSGVLSGRADTTKTDEESRP